MKHIDQAWQSYAKMVVPKDAGKVQIEETRQAFFAGASTLFTSIMLVMDTDREPTEKDLAVMSDIQNEIDDFGRSLDKKILGYTVDDRH